MTLRFPYQPISQSHPIVPLGGRQERPRPIIGVTVIGPSDSRLREGLLDSGADDTVFPATLAPVLGIDLSNAPTGRAGTPAGAVFPVRYARVGLRITDGIEWREWQAWVGFTPVKLHYSLLGFAGFLQFFDTNLRGALEVAELTINNLYPGT